MKNPFGLRDGQLLTVWEVERGLACNCICPACNHPLQAHKGQVRTNHYFSHYKGSDCGYGLETALHMLAKEILADEKKLLVRALQVTSDQAIALVGTRLESCYIIRWPTVMTFDEVYLEKRLEGVVPDVVLTKENRELLVEIKVTNGVDENKRARIIEQNISAVEIDLSKVNRAITKDILKKVLISGYGGKNLVKRKWIHNSYLPAVTERLNRQYRQKYLEQPEPINKTNEDITL